MLPPTGRQCDRHRSRGHQHQDAGGVGAALGVDVGVEEPGDQESDRSEHEHQRPHRPRPPRGHTVAGQVPRDQVQQARHRGGAGEPENGDGAHVIHGPETRAEVLVGQKRQGAAVGLASGLEFLLRDQDHGREAGGDQESTHDDGRGGQEPSGPLDPADRPIFGIPGPALDLRHHGHPGLETGQAQRQLREDQQRDPDHHERIPVRGGQCLPPAAHGNGVSKRFKDGGDHHHDIQSQVDADQDDRHTDGLLEAAQEDGAQQGEQEQRDRHILSLHPTRNERVLDRMGRGIGCRERHSDHEVSRCEPQQHQNQQFPAPARQQPLQHGDGPLAPVALPRNPAVHGQGTQQGDRNQHHGRQR
ncbi:hypothetical protein D9M72_368380 [compost metagenome]